MSASCSNKKSEVFRNYRVALSVNSCDKLFHIEARQSSARQCWLVLAYIASSITLHILHFTIQRIEIWRLKYQRDYLKSELQFNFLFTLKNAHLYIHTYITFISGAKPIAENRHNMKRTKIKHTTHTHKPIDRKN